MAVVVTLSAMSFAASDNSSPISQTGFTATLANGATVEIAGVCKFKEGKVQECWKPDGMPLDTPNWSIIYPDLCCGFIIRLGGTFDVNLLHLGRDNEPVCIPALSSGGWYRLDVHDQADNLIKDLLAVIVPVDSNHASNTLRVGFETEHWKDANMSAICTVEKFEQNNVACVTVAYQTHGDGFRALAIDNNGNVHIGRIIPISRQRFDSFISHQRTFEFDLPASDIKKFQFQTCPRQWITFKNVSMRPGQKTQVKSKP